MLTMVGSCDVGGFDLKPETDVGRKVFFLSTSRKKQICAGTEKSKAKRPSSEVLTHPGPIV